MRTLDGRPIVDYVVNSTQYTRMCLQGKFSTIACLVLWWGISCCTEQDLLSQADTIECMRYVVFDVHVH